MPHIPTGLRLPAGPAVELEHNEAPDLMHNEFIVYEEARVRFRYVLQVRFTGDL